jgi:ribonuclease BN (tRNA processing enzyme)
MPFLDFRRMGVSKILRAEFCRNDVIGSKHITAYKGDGITFKHVTRDFCTGFIEYLQTAQNGTYKRGISEVNPSGLLSQGKRENHTRGRRKPWRGWRKKSKGTQKAHHYGYQWPATDGRNTCGKRK